jgi:predicted enzyme related to lactoylglutathione lyase
MLNGRRQIMHGDVSFLELGSSEPDTSKSLAFFAAVFGWQVHPVPQGGGWFQGPRIRVGVHGGDPGPKIYVFFGVPNLEAAMDAVRRAGGHAHPLITDEPNFGRFANCRDPLGIPFGLHQA